ncbi:MRN complex-interacting protein [Centropristis striata]|uniref:MRN complex-interacting protein n=1 Tax=Centropristis striata TaxID=184440 RepID=UPI0027E01031|nr:MRN complex-interacting protein [Centropristis striata]
MVQEFQVLRCFTCESFQVQQVKKSSRWICKVCGEKQSLLKEFGRGSAADCRRHVQKLNAARGAKMEEDTWLLWKRTEADGEDDQPRLQVSQAQVSRWSKYLDTPEEAEPEEAEPEEGEENVLMDRQQLHGNKLINSSDRKRRRTSPPSQGRTSPSSQRHISPPSQRRTSPPSQGRTSPSSQRRTSPPSQRRTSPSSQRHISPPSQRRTSPPSQGHISPPSQRRTSPPSQRHTRPPSQRRTSPPSQRRTSPPSQRRTSPPSLRSTGPVSRWAGFLSTDCQADEGEEPAASGRSHAVRPLEKPRPLLPVSMFESGEDFSWDF